jgi:hypothetical protein
MSMHSWARLGLALPAFAFALGLSSSLASRFPVGSYDSDAYTFTFDSTGAFLYLKGDQLMVHEEFAQLWERDQQMPRFTDREKHCLSLSNRPLSPTGILRQCCRNAKAFGVSLDGNG